MDMGEPFNSKQGAILELQTRKTIYLLIQIHQGSHLRGLERVSGIALSTLRHHLAFLVKHGLLKEEKEGQNLRYFTVELSTEQIKLLTLLRQQTIRRILIFLTIKQAPGHKELADFVHLSPATVTWHAKKLIERGLITSEKSGRETHYRLAVDKDTVIHLLLAYRQSFIDRILDHAAEMWEM